MPRREPTATFAPSSAANTYQLCFCRFPSPSTWRRHHRDEPVSTASLRSRKAGNHLGVIDGSERPGRSRQWSILGPTVSVYVQQICLPLSACRSNRHCKQIEPRPLHGDASLPSRTQNARRLPLSETWSCVIVAVQMAGADR